MTHPLWLVSQMAKRVAIAAWLLFGYGVLSLLRLWWFGAGLPSTATGWGICALALLVFAGVSRSLYMDHSLTRLLVAVLVAVSAVLMPIYKPAFTCRCTCCSLCCRCWPPR